MNYSILDIFGGNEEKVETNYNYGCDTDGFVDVKVSNEIYMSEVEASYNRKIIGAFLCSISSIIIPAIVIILSLMNKGWLFRRSGLKWLGKKKTILFFILKGMMGR